MRARVGAYPARRSARRPANRENTIADAIKLITDEHREMERLFERMRKEPKRRGELLPQVAAMFIAHSRAEEEKVYPAVAEQAGARGEAHHGAEEHAEAEALLHELERMDPSGKEFERKFATFVEAVDHHVMDEEREVLPALRDAVNKQRLNRLGRDFIARRDQELARRGDDAPRLSKRECTPRRGISASLGGPA